MAKIIEQLRGLHGEEGYDADNDGKFNTLNDDLLNDFKKDYKVEYVEDSFEEGGRWTNYEHTVYKITDGKDEAYFQLTQEVPATEMQEGGGFFWSFYEVIPKEVVKTVFEIRE